MIFLNILNSYYKIFNTPYKQFGLVLLILIISTIFWYYCNKYKTIEEFGFVLCVIMRLGVGIISACNIIFCFSVYATMPEVMIITIILYLYIIIFHFFFASLKIIDP